MLYLLHGQTFEDDQWVRLGAATVADNLIHRGEAPPFIIVFPDDRYWNLPPARLSGERLIDEIIPYIDKTYRTRAERQYRALGGLSRGGGWAVHHLLTRYDLFGMIGLHSPVIFNDDAAILERLDPGGAGRGVAATVAGCGRPRRRPGLIRRFEELLTVESRAARMAHLQRRSHRSLLAERTSSSTCSGMPMASVAPTAPAAASTANALSEASQPC